MTGVQTCALPIWTPGSELKWDSQAFSGNILVLAGSALFSMYAVLAKPLLRHYHWLPSVRGDLLAKLGRGAEARAEFERAASLTRNAQEKALLLARACG